jgi:CHAD domain-containing protein
MIATKSSTLPSARATPHTKPLTDFRALLLGTLNDRWRTFRAELKRCQKKYSEAAVHDLRVATRRLISTLDLLASVYPEGRLRKARRALKRQLDKFGPLRDVQVQLLSIDKMLPTFPELQAYYDFLLKRERKLVQRLDADIKQVKTGKVQKVIRAAIAQVDVLLDSPEMQQEKRAEAVRAVEAAFNRVVERKQGVDPTDSGTIHRMRVAFKKFRYMIESLAPMLDWVTSRRLKAMNAFQGSMGDIQDAEVLFTSATTFTRKHGAESEASLTRALDELARRRTALVDAFSGSADALYTFWKPPS